jgi:multidrug efflux pump
VIAGGLIFAGILTLFIIPAVYSFLSSNKKNNVSIDQPDPELKSLEHEIL